MRALRLHSALLSFTCCLVPGLHTAEVVVNAVYIGIISLVLRFSEWAIVIQTFGLQHSLSQ